MVIGSEIQNKENDDHMTFKRLALRDAVICIGWLKLISVAYYICLYFMTHIYSRGDVSTVLRVMILIVIPVQILHGSLLFYGALEDKLTPLELSMWLCLITASYNTVLGTIGCIYFIRIGYDTIHFLLACAFILLALSLFAVLCHDVLMVYAYKQIVVRTRNQDSLDSLQSEMSKV